MAIRSRPAGPNVPTELISPAPPADPPDPPPERELWPWLLVLLLLVIAGIAAAWYATRDSGGASSLPPTRLTTVASASAKAKPKKRQTTPTVTGPTVLQVTVPNLLGRRRDDAVRSLGAQGLKAWVNEVPSEQEPGLIVAQHPRGESKVAKGSSVTINISKGPSKPAQVTVTVPEVVGQSKDAATNAIRATGLEPSIQHVPSTQPSDTVVSQSPAGSSSAHEGDHVLINISDGPKKENVTPTKTETSQQPPASQQPQASQQPPASQQPATKPVPSVIGEDEATARADLQAAGFSVSSVDRQTSDQSQDGTVIDQSPPGGNDADPNTTVTIYLARYSSG